MLLAESVDSSLPMHAIVQLPLFQTMCYGSNMSEDEVNDECVHGFHCSVAMDRANNCLQTSTSCSGEVVNVIR